MKIKAIFLSMVVLLMAGTIKADVLPVLPMVADFEVVLSQDKLDISAGKSTTITATINRIKGFKKTKFTMVANAPAGIEVNFVETATDTYDVEVKVDPAMATGSYSFMVTGKNNIMNKGTILTVNVAAENSISNSK